MRCWQREGKEKSVKSFPSKDINNGMATDAAADVQGIHSKNPVLRRRGLGGYSSGRYILEMRRVAGFPSLVSRCTHCSLIDLHGTHSLGGRVSI